jgi:hypothetical protein
MFTAPPVFVLGSANPFKESVSEVIIPKGTLGLSHPGQRENVTLITGDCGLGYNAVVDSSSPESVWIRRNTKECPGLALLTFCGSFSHPTNSTSHLLHVKKSKQAGREASRWLERRGQCSAEQYVAYLSDREGERHPPDGRTQSSEGLSLLDS